MTHTEEPALPIVRLHEGTRKKPKVGDLFVQQLLATRQYVWGLVVNTQAHSEPATGLLLLYFSKVTSPKDDEPPIAVEEFKNNLIIPPVITNRQGWLRGYYKTVRNVTLKEEGILHQHCFEDSLTGLYSNEFDKTLPKRTEPCGLRGVSSFPGIAEFIESQLVDSQ